MPFSIDNWNINENVIWYVRMADTGADISVKLFRTQAGAEANDSSYDSYATVAYGSDVEVALEPNTDVSDVELFQTDLDWHLRVSGQNGDSIVVYKVGVFTDLPEIRDPIYANEDLILSRATAEINEHTHMKFPRTLGIPDHLESVSVGDVIQLTSTRRNKTEKSQVMSKEIGYSVTSNEVSLRTTLVTASYLAMRRE